MQNIQLFSWFVTSLQSHTWICNDFGYKWMSDYNLSNIQLDWIFWRLFVPLVPITGNDNQLNGQKNKTTLCTLFSNSTQCCSFWTRTFLALPPKITTSSITGTYFHNFYFWFMILLNYLLLLWLFSIENQ
jgi:hypothetical protein